MLKIWLKIDIFDHSDLQRMKFCKIKKNFDLCWKFGSKMQFLTTLDLAEGWNLEIKIQKFSVPLKIWLEIESLTTPDLAKDVKMKTFWSGVKI